MKEIAAALLAWLGEPGHADLPVLPEDDNWHVAERQFLRFGDHVVIFLAEKASEKRLGIAALREKYLPEGFVGERVALPGGGMLLTGLCERKNAAALRRHCPKCAASAPASADEVTVAEDFAGTKADFPLFVGNEANICALRDELTFAAFADGMARRYALGGTAPDAATAARLLDCGATVVEFVPGNDVTEALPPEYRDKIFVVTDECAVKVTDAVFPADILREAEKIARLAAAHHAVWRMRLKKSLAVAEHLVLARELYKKNAAPQEIAANFEGKLEDHAAIAAQYGKYEIKTVSK